MTEFNYSIEDDYKEMDAEWWGLMAPTEEELRTGNLRDTASNWDLSQHELWPRIQAEGWRILLPGVDGATIGKRVNDLKVYIGVKTNWSMKYGQFKWSIVVESPEGIEPAKGMYIYTNRLERGEPMRSKYDLPAKQNYPGHNRTYLVKVADSLGQALDIVKYRQLEGFAPITPGRLDLDTGPNQDPNYWMDLIP